MINHNDKLIVALDVETVDEAKKMIDVLSPAVNVFKVGSQIFTSVGPSIIQFLAERKKKVFLDLKYHDIPNTVANAVTAAVTLNASYKDKTSGIFMITVHTIGGEEMLKRAAEAALKTSQKLNVPKPMVVGITVLTSDDRNDNVAAIVLDRARLAKTCGLDGIVASSQEAQMLRKELGKDFIIVTPGIRPSGAEAGDQKRITTPKEAMENGSNFLVVGRPILKASDPLKAARSILEEII
jgi:orotidine-5'-phosphate decarboxylase